MQAHNVASCYIFYIMLEYPSMPHLRSFLNEKTSTDRMKTDTSKKSGGSCDVNMYFAPDNLLVTCLTGKQPNLFIYSIEFWKWTCSAK